jgi:hypothetical protein
LVLPNPTAAYSDAIEVKPNLRTARLWSAQILKAANGLGGRHVEPHTSRLAR